MERRYDVDRLRALLFALLVLHHVAVGFAPFGADVYGFANDRDGGDLVSLAIYWSHSWRLPTLFLIAGMGTWWATARAADGPALGRRLLRLLAPFAAGCLLLNLPAGWAVEAILGQPLPRGARTEWWLPVPPWIAMHLWFLANLALYTLLLWPAFARRGWAARLPAPPTLAAGLAGTAAAVAVAGKPWGEAIAGDGYQLAWYAAFFAGGAMIGARAEECLGWAARRWVWLALAALALFLTEVTFIEITRPRSDALAEALAAGGWASQGLAPAWGVDGIRFAAVESLGAWAWALAALGAAARFLRFDGPVLRAVGPAVFPVYVFHFPVVIIGLALLAQVDRGLWPEFLALCAAAYGISWLGWLAARRLGRWGVLFGARPRG